MINPCVLFASCCEFKSKSVIEKFFGGNLVDGTEIDPNLIAYPWHIDNKYYTADVNLIALENKQLLDSNIGSLVSAVVLYFDSSSPYGLESAESFLPFLLAYDADVNILVCDSCQEDGRGILKRCAQEWCIAKGFELVELNPSEEVDPEDDFPETTGIDRIRQALQAHTWSNLTLKAKNPSEVKTAQIRSALNGVLGDQSGEEDDDFGGLLSHLSDIRSFVCSLSEEDRKEAAEVAVKAIFESIFDEPDDIEDL